MENSNPLNICLVSYRSNPHCGGQGVYLKNLAGALKELGHHVEVISGPPDPLLDDDIPFHQIECLDLYNPDNPFRIPSLRELADPVNLAEWIGVSTMGFPEPFTFGLRLYQFMRNVYHRYDIVHDNQSLSYAIWAISRWVPVVATIHHPITVDREIAIKTAPRFIDKMQQTRWFSFLGMQKRVSRNLSHIITVSKCARNDISADFKIPAKRFHVVPNGINTDLFYPIPEIKREKNRIIVTNSADIPLKGLFFLLKAVADLSKTHEIKLVVIGTPKKNGMVENLVRELGIGRLLTFTGRISDQDFVRQYARATIAVVPSVYEGFGIPAGEAMACRVPVISTTGGALPEVVGDAGILVPPADPHVLSKAISDLLENPGKAQVLGEAGFERIHKFFTWKKAAEKTIEAYREAIRDHR